MGKFMVDGCFQVGICPVRSTNNDIMQGTSRLVFLLRLPLTFRDVSRRSDVARPVSTEISKPQHQPKAYRAGYQTISRILK